MAVTKLERQLALIAELLETQRPLTASELRERLDGYPPGDDSFRRAFERDKADLREMGLPITVATVPGSVPREDGYRILADEYAFPDPGLEADEMAALQLAAVAVRLEGTDAASGIRKLQGLPLADVAEAVSPADDLPVVVLANAPQLATVFDATAQRCQLRFGYRDTPRVVDPVRLRHERGHWYLQAYDHGAGAARSFRLDRIDGPVETGAPQSAEVELSADDFPRSLEAWSLGDDEPVTATVRVRPPQARWAARAVGETATATWEDDGSVCLNLEVRHPSGFRSFVLSFLDAAEILGPDELRADMVDWLRDIAGPGDVQPSAGGGR